MPLPVIANCFRVAFHWTNSAGGYAVSVMHFVAPGHSEAELRAAINANWTNEQQETMSSVSDMDTMEIIKLDGTSPTHELDGVGNSTGQGGAQCIAGEATLVSFHSLVRGPRGRGRIFLPFVAEDMQQNGTLADASRVIQEGAWTAFILDMTADGVTPVVASYVHSAAYEIEYASIRPIVGTQKRRLKRLVS